MPFADGCGRPNRRDIEYIPKDAILFQALNVDASSTKNEVTTVGRTQSGKRIIARICNFRQYFYVQALPFDQTGIKGPLHLLKMLKSKALECEFPHHRWKYKSCSIVDVTEHQKKSFYGYNPNTTKMYKITINRPHNMAGVKHLVKTLYNDLRDRHIPRDSWNFSSAHNENFPPLEMYDVDDTPNYVTKFFANTGFKATLWSILKKYQILNAESDNKEVKDGDVNSNMDIRVEFMDIITVPKDYKPLPPPAAPSTFAHLEPKHLIGGWSSIAPFKIMVFDIECVNKFKPYQFPDKTSHPISQISVLIYNNNDNIPSMRILLTTHKCHKGSGTIMDGDGPVIIENFALESQLLNYFAYIVKKHDPDIVSGYNVDQFDLSYIECRASITGAQNVFTSLSRYKGEHFYMDDRLQMAEFERSQTRSSTNKKSGAFKNVYSKANKIPVLPGRTVLDVYRGLVTNGFNFPSFKLGDVSKQLLGDKQKQDMPYHKIGEAHFGSPYSIAELCMYCMQDSNLAYAILQKSQLVQDYIEKSRVFGLPLQTLITRGQQISGLAMYADNIQQNRNGLYLFPEIIPPFADPKFYLDSIKTKVHASLKREEKQIERNEVNTLLSDEEILAYFQQFLNSSVNKTNKGYAGAVVMEPVVGFFTGDDKVIVNDYEALYPNIIKSSNACVSSLTTLEELHKFIPNAKVNEDYIIVPDVGTIFVTKKHHEGIIPDVVKRLLEARKEVKKQIKQLKNIEDNPEIMTMISLLDLRQLNIKRRANSVYGLIGARCSKMQALSIASAITALGRNMIKVTKLVIERCIPGGKVIYGDTDSTFTLLPKTSLQEAIEQGERISRIINGTESTGNPAFDRFIQLSVPRPNSLAFEKVIENFLIYKKKKYVGRMIEGVGSTPKLLTKGIEIVRNDVPVLIKQVLKESMEYLIMQDDPVASIECVREMVASLYADNGSGEIVPLELYSISKTIKCEEYIGNPVHAVLRKRLLMQKPSLAPEVGEKIKYVICNTGAKNNGEKARLVQEMELDPSPPPIDRMYYINMLEKAITRLWELILIKLLGPGKTPHQVMFDIPEVKSVGRGSTQRAFKALFGSNGSAGMEKEKIVCIRKECVPYIEWKRKRKLSGINLTNTEQSKKVKYQTKLTDLWK